MVKYECIIAFQEDKMNIILDSTHAAIEMHRRWLGAGMISSSGSSRLLLDYKQHRGCGTG